VLVSSTQQQGQAPGVVIYHGVLAAKEWLTFYSQVLASHGFVVLAIDQAGHGATSGFRTGNALQIDGVAAFRFLSNQSDLVDPQRIGILGWSMGGGTAFSVGQVLGPTDGLKSTVVVGMNVMHVAQLFTLI
jgi:dienelactone hydrolase